MNFEDFFNTLVNITEPICQKIDSVKASMTIFDSSGIEAYIQENNPKYANRIIKCSMPSHSSANSEIKQFYINGHLC